MIFNDFKTNILIFAVFSFTFYDNRLILFHNEIYKKEKISINIFMIYK